MVNSKSKLSPSARNWVGLALLACGNKSGKIISIPLVYPLGLVQEATISSDLHIIRSLIEHLLNSYNSNTLLWVLEANLIPVLCSWREDYSIQNPSNLQVSHTRKNQEVDIMISNGATSEEWLIEVLCQKGALGCMGIHSSLKVR